MSGKKKSHWSIVFYEVQSLWHARRKWHFDGDTLYFILNWILWINVLHAGRLIGRLIKWISDMTFNLLHLFGEKKWGEYLQSQALSEDRWMVIDTVIITSAWWPKLILSVNANNKLFFLSQRILFYEEYFLEFISSSRKL